MARAFVCAASEAAKCRLLNPLQTYQVAVGLKPGALCGFKGFRRNTVVTKQKGRRVTIDGQGTTVVTCVDTGTLMCHSEAKLIGYRQGVE